MRKLNRGFFVGMLLALAAFHPTGIGLAQAPPDTTQAQPATSTEPFLVRLNLQGGQATQGDRMANTEFGVDLMLSANPFQRYGIHVSTLSLDASPTKQRFLCTGYVLEMVLFQWLRAEIGTVGFIGRGEASGNNPFGVLYALGYEKRVGRMNYSITYESKTVFTKPVIAINNLGISVGVHF
ncbi:MAG: hypothetical protein IPN59_12585 [Holophaga sp.]|nr:hypothetical protein [Holophaga sp.]